MRKGAVRKRIARLITTGLVASSLAMPGIAAAHTSEAIAETDGMILTLPGVGLNVDIALDELGNIEEVVVVGPAAGPGAGAEVPTIDDSHRVRFEIDEDGTRVSVMARKHKLTGKVQAGTLAELAGPHEWAAVVFPELLTDATTVRFTIDDLGSAAGISGVAVDGLPPEAGYAIAAGDDNEDATVVITFVWNGYAKVLKIKIDVDDDEDGPSAVLRVELRATDRQRLRDELASFVGNSSWSGLLCDGTNVAVAYMIGADGSLEFGRVTMNGIAATEGYSVKDQERGFQVRFDGTKSRLRVRFGEADDGLWDLKVDARTTGKCRHKGDAGRKNKPDKDRSSRDKDTDDGAGDG